MSFIMVFLTMLFIGCNNPSEKHLELESAQALAALSKKTSTKVEQQEAEISALHAARASLDEQLQAAQTVSQL